MSVVGGTVIELTFKPHGGGVVFTTPQRAIKASSHRSPVLVLRSTPLQRSLAPGIWSLTLSSVGSIGALPRCHLFSSLALFVSLCAICSSSSGMMRNNWRSHLSVDSTSWTLAGSDASFVGDQCPGDLIGLEELAPLPRSPWIVTYRTGMSQGYCGWLLLYIMLKFSDTELTLDPRRR